MDWEDRKALSDIHSLKQQYPDSALFLLDVAFHPRLMSNKLIAEWCMLNGDLRDSFKKDMNIDTAYLRRALLSGGRRNRQAKAGLYLARACLEYDDYNLTGYISSYLADLYEEEWNHDESAKLYGQAASFFLKANIRSYGIALRDRGGVCVVRKNYDRALAFYSKADSIVWLLNDTILISSMANCKGILYLEMRKYDLAEKFLIQSIRLDSTDNVTNYMYLSKLYVLQNKPELAKIIWIVASTLMMSIRRLLIGSRNVSCLN